MVGVGACDVLQSITPRVSTRTKAAGKGKKALLCQHLVVVGKVMVKANLIPDDFQLQWFDEKRS